MAAAGLLLLFWILTFIHVRARLVLQSERRTTSDPGLKSASWIWIPNSHGSASTSSGTAAFVRSFTTPSGKTASSAEISMSAVDHFTVWCNGQPIGASPTAQDSWKSAQLLRAPLNASTNVFSVLVTNNGRSSVPPGLLADIQIAYSDSTSSTLLSDSSWLATGDIPSDFPLPSDLSRFSSAVVAAGQNVSLPSPNLTPLSLQASLWIWSTPNSIQGAPVGYVGFRRTFTSPSGKAAQSATVLLTVDNSFDLFVNGEYVGSPPQDHAITNWQHPQLFAVNLTSALNVFTVFAQNFAIEGTTGNTPSAAGFIAAIKILYADNSSDLITTDPSWLAGASISASAFLATDDSLLSSAISQGPLGTAPWTQLDAPSNVLNAALVPTSPFSTTTTLSPATSAPASPAPHSVPVAEIVSPIVGGLVLIALIVAFFWWWRRRSSFGSTRTKHTSFASIRPFSGYASLPSTDGSSANHPRAATRTPGGVAAPIEPPPGYDEFEQGPSQPLVAGVNGPPQRRKPLR
ncbi:hypothetical protein C8R46DRAFT_385183 [Mycena filopes]|nr:hypothetical protein C8R46DRAFT_385183 [Mycena filopes]